MYHKGYVEALPVQLPEVTELIREYFKSHYNHNYICEHKHKLVAEFKERFVPWLNQGHLKFKGLKDFKNVYIRNGVTEFIQIVIPDHNLRPITHHKKEYSAYKAHAGEYIKSGVKLDNKVDVISLPFCRTGSIFNSTPFKYSIIISSGISFSPTVDLSSSIDIYFAKGLPLNNKSYLSDFSVRTLTPRAPFPSGGLNTTSLSGYPNFSAASTSSAIVLTK